MLGRPAEPEPARGAAAGHGAGRPAALHGTLVRDRQHSPYFAERDVVASRAEWTLRQDGRIDDDVFVGRRGGFDKPESRYQFLDTVVPGSGGGAWRVRLFWPIHVSQLTLYVDPDYRYTLIGYPGKSLGWIFSREPEMDEATYRSLLARFDAMGYDTSRFRRVPQLPAQLGQPGFASPPADK